MTRAALLERIRGCLLGGAVGDALGAPVEFTRAEGLRERFPDGMVRQFVEGEHGRGAITDDTQLTLFTAEGLVLAYQRGRDRGIWHPPSMVHDAYARWLRTQNGQRSHEGEALAGWLLGYPALWSRRAPGGTCLRALAQPRMGTIEDPLNDSKGCGGVMRAAPAGLIGHPNPFRLGCELAAITHGHPSGYLSAGVLAYTVSRIVEGAGLREAVEYALPILRKFAGHEECDRALGAALDLAATGPGTPEKVARLGRGWVGEEALAIGVYCALVSESLEEALPLAVSHEGDSDSTGSITGNLLGALHGAAGVPDRWLAELELRDAIELTAARLAECVPTRE